MNRGSLGIRELNVRLQNELNPARADEPVVEKFGWQFRPRDKVIQTENDYDKDVFNGDIGQIVKIDPVEREVTIRFDQREVVYDFGELDEISLAYAITIHKSQGSEFPVGCHPAGDAAIPAVAAQSRLHRHHAGQKAGGAHRPAEGAGDGGEEQQDGEPVFRAACQIDCVPRRRGGKSRARGKDMGNTMRQGHRLHFLRFGRMLVDVGRRPKATSICQAQLAQWDSRQIYNTPAYSCRFQADFQTNESFAHKAKPPLPPYLPIAADAAHFPGLRIFQAQPWPTSVPATFPVTLGGVLWPKASCGRTPL